MATIIGRDGLPMTVRDTPTKQDQAKSFVEEFKKKNKRSGGGSSSQTNINNEQPVPLSEVTNGKANIPTSTPVEDTGVKTAIDGEVGKASNAYRYDRNTPLARQMDEVAYVGSIRNVGYSKPGTLPTREEYVNTRAKAETYKVMFNEQQGTITNFKENPGKYINTGQALGTTTKEGEVITATPDLFKDINPGEIYKGRYEKAYYDVRSSPDLTTGQRVDMATGSFIVGLGKGVDSIKKGFASPFTGSLTSYKEVDGKIIKQGVSLPESNYLKEYNKQPNLTPTVSFLDKPFTYIGQTVSNPQTLGKATVIAPLAVAGIEGLANNIKTYGVAKGFGETATGILPVKFSNKVYVNEFTKANIVTARTDLGNGDYIRVGYGRTPGLKGIYSNGKIVGVSDKIELVEFNYKGVTGGYSKYQTPFTQVTSSGDIKGGVRTIINTQTSNTFKTTNAGYFSGNIGLNGKGATSFNTRTSSATYFNYENGQTIKYLNTNVKETLVNSFSTSEVNGVSRFASGNTNAVDYLTGSKTPIKIRGFEINVNQFNLNNPSTANRFTGAKGFNNVKGKGGLSSVENLGDVKPLQTSLDFQNNIKGISTQTTKTTPIVKVSQQSNYAFGMVDYGNTLTRDYGTTTGPLVLNRPTTTNGFNNFNGLNFVDVIKPRTTTKSGSNLGFDLRQTPRTTEINKDMTKTVQTPINIVKVRIIPKLGEASAFKFATPSGGNSFNFSPIPPINNIPFALPPLGLGGGGDMLAGGGNVKAAKSITSYTPSFTALVFGIKGKAPKGRANTGINFRPITKGFKFTRVKKLKI